jgi:hypothetical protein
LYVGTQTDESIFDELIASALRRPRKSNDETFMGPKEGERYATLYAMQTNDCRASGRLRFIRIAGPRVSAGHYSHASS